MARQGGSSGLYRQILVIVFLCIYGTMLMAPLYWMFTTAFKGPSITIKFPPELFPTNPTLANFRELFSKTPIMRWTWNTLLVAGISTVIYVLTSTMAGYAFAKKNVSWKGSSILALYEYNDGAVLFDTCSTICSALKHEST